MPRKTKQTKAKQRQINCYLSEEEFELATLLIEQEGLGKKDVLKVGLIELAKKHIPQIKDWDSFQLAAKGHSAELQAEKEKEENKRLKVENQSLRAIVSSNSEVIDDFDESQYEHDKRDVYLITR